MADLKSFFAAIRRGGAGAAPSQGALTDSEKEHVFGVKKKGTFKPDALNDEQKKRLDLFRKAQI